MSSPAAGERGQAAAEFVALLPLLAAVVAVLWQVVLAGHAVWGAAAAAGAAARAAAVGGDPRHAARGVRHDARVRRLGDGAVRVVVPIPSLVLDLGTTSAEAQFAPQE